MSPPTSVLFPTTTPSPVIQALTDQLASCDELLIICDDETDPVVDYAAELENTRVVVAGEPVGCSGKANAIATGIKAAAHDRIVWTDDDFHHLPEWLTGLHQDYECEGPVSELYFFQGTDPLSVLLEPIYAIGGTFGTYANDKASGGAVMFERDDLDVDAFLRALRQTVSDDALLSEYLDVTPLKRRWQALPHGKYNYRQVGRRGARDRRRGDVCWPVSTTGRGPSGRRCCARSRG